MYNLGQMPLPPQSMFDQSIKEQIAVNLARTPTERFLAMCDMLDAIRAMAPRTPEAAERRLRDLAAREKEREQFRAQCQRWAAAQRASSPEEL